MARNSLVDFDVRPDYSYTAPQEVERTRSPKDYQRPGRHPLTDPLMKPNVTSAPGNRHHVRTGLLPGQDTCHRGKHGESTVLDNLSIYEGEFSGISDQPNSFPQRRKGHRHFKPYSSLDTNIQRVSSFSPHHTLLSHDHHSCRQQSTSGSVDSPSCGEMSGQELPQLLSRGGDLQQIVPRASRTKQSHSKLPIQVGNRATEKEQTASSVFRSEHSHRPDSSSVSAGPSRASKLHISESQSLESGSYHIPQIPSGKYCSQATLENARYSLDMAPTADHSNEDRYFAVEGTGFKIFCVCDGHNGSRASGFASDYLMKLFYEKFWTNILSNPNRHNLVCEVLGEMFRDTEKSFFKSIEYYVKKKNSLQSKIPQHLTSYAAYQKYPYEVMELQEVEPKLTGGSTIVLAITVDDILYLANVGDSRAVLVRECNGVLVADQLTVDHTVENEDELKRLEALGLDSRELIRAGRLGTQENTRSIGDYSIKAGYKDVDSLRFASCAPGIATPYVMPGKKIDHSFKYLILMTDGVYKGIEGNLEEPNPNKALVSMLEHSLEVIHGQFEYLSSNLLDRIATINHDCYIKSARTDGVRSARAVACRKRDDMTLVVYRFPHL